MALTAVEWNKLAGNDPEKASLDQISNQFSYVIEEAKELVDAADDNDRLEMLDALCDIKYTFDVLEQMIINHRAYEQSEKPTQYVTILEESKKAHDRGDVDTAMALLIAFQAMTEGLNDSLASLMNIQGAYEEVCANNDLKINMDEAHALETMEYYDQQGVETYLFHTGERDGVDRFCVKRKSDDKIMKFENFPKVELEQFL